MLRDLLVSAPVLAIYNQNRETELHTDASSAGFGAVLMQRQDDGKFHPVAYFSKSTTSGEANLHSYELETLAIVYALNRFEDWLDGIHFTIVTDNDAVKYTLSNGKLNKRVQRWTMAMQHYKYSIKHRKGVSMGHVGALSRRHTIAYADVEDDVELKLLIAQVAEKVNHAKPSNKDRQQTAAYADANELDFQIQVAQNRDEGIQELVVKLEAEEVEGYELVDGVAFRRDKDNRLQLMVPDEMEDDIIRMIHEKIGHMSVDKSYEQICKHYWFPGMKAKVENFIRNCVRCIVNAAPPRAGQANLHSIPKVSVPFDTLHVDHFGPLPSLKSKRKHVLVIVDAFTKMVRLYPVNSTSSREVCASLDKYFSYYSRPRRIITDRGTAFTSNEFTEYPKKHNVSHVKVAVASPQANGQVERVNRVLKSTLAKITDPIDHADWSNKLSQVEYALNNTVQKSIKQTPSKLLFGIEQRGEIVDELTEYLEEKFAYETDRDLIQIRADADSAIKRSQEYNELYFLKHSIPAKTYAAGDFVVIRNTDTTVGSNKKLIAKYRGPYVIRRVLPNDRYVVTDIDNCQVTQMPYDGIVEAKRIRKWTQKRDSNDHSTECNEGNTVPSS